MPATLRLFDAYQRCCPFAANPFNQPRAKLEPDVAALYLVGALSIRGARFPPPPLSLSPPLSPSSPLPSHLSHLLVCSPALPIYSRILTASCLRTLTQTILLTI
jgi:hypothetical protein